MVAWHDRRRIFDILEKDIEEYWCRVVKGLGGIPFKFTSPQRRSVPDRMNVFPWGQIVFVEVKRPKEKSTSAQLREQNRLREMSQWVEEVDTFEKCDLLIAEILMRRDL